MEIKVVLVFNRVLRPDIWRDVETKTLQDQKISSMSRPRPTETELSRPRRVSLITEI